MSEIQKQAVDPSKQLAYGHVLRKETAADLGLSTAGVVEHVTGRDPFADTHDAEEMGVDNNTTFSDIAGRLTTDENRSTVELITRIIQSNSAEIRFIDSSGTVYFTDGTSLNPFVVESETESTPVQKPAQKYSPAPRTIMRYERKVTPTVQAAAKDDAFITVLTRIAESLERIEKHFSERTS